MKKILLILFVLLFAKAFSQQDSTAVQQDDDYSPYAYRFRHGVRYTFKTSAGTVFKGFVVKETSEYVTIEDRDNQQTYELKASEIVYARITSDRKSYEDTSLGENYHARNYMLAQSALPFEAGQASSTSHMFLLDNIDYGLSEHWALTANTLAFFYPICIGVKCSFEISEGNYVGGNVFGVGFNYSSYSGNGVFGYGFIGRYTKGNSNENFTASAGVIGLNNDVLFGTGAPFVNTSFISAAYCRRISQNIAINAEGWYLPGTDAGLLGGAVKLVGNEVTSWTFGCFMVMSERNNSLQLNFKALPIPYIGVSRNF